MNTSELYQLTEWVEQHIARNNVLQKYQALYDILKLHVESSGPRPSFVSQRDDLLDTLVRMPVNYLSNNQVQFLDDLDVSSSIGQQGADQVEDTLYRNVIDVATSTQAISQLMENLRRGCERCQQIQLGLQGVSKSHTHHTTGDVLMRVVFSGDSAIDNVADFKRWGESWYDIGYGIAFANSEQADQVKIVGAATGSVVLELSVSYKFSKTASDIVLAALQLTEKIQDINQKVEELRRLQLKNSKLVLDLEKEAEYESRMGVENISAAVIQTIGLRKNGEGDKITALMKAVKYLIHFIENGGDIEFIMSQLEDESEDTEIMDQLQNKFQLIRQLKNKLANAAEQVSVTEAA